MTAPREERVGWTIQQAESLLLSLKGVVSARVVARPGGKIDEIHVLTSHEVKPKQTVRNVESALLASLDIEVDHRKISVAQTTERQAPDVMEAPAPVMLVTEEPAGMNRLLFHGHQVETERSHQVRHRVEIEWKGERFIGESTAADLPRATLEAVSQATLRSVEAALTSELSESGRSVALALDGVKVVDAFDRRFVLVAVHAISGRDTRPLAGATVVEDSTGRAAILATLQATDRWVRGRV